jgi:creatinine amidohydrolase
MLLLMENLNWMQIEGYLKRDDRIIFPLGSMEQHGYLTVATDTQAAWEISKAASEKTGVLVAPPLNYSFAGWATAWPGTVSIKSTTLLALLLDILESFVDQGFKRILIVNGHGQNEFAAKLALEEISWRKPDANIKCRSWFLLPKTKKTIEENSSLWGHAGWLESFQWINQPTELPKEPKGQYLDQDYFTLGPKNARAFVGDGQGGGDYVKDEKFMRQYFNVAVDEIVEVLEGSWDKHLSNKPPA